MKINWEQQEFDTKIIGKKVARIINSENLYNKKNINKLIKDLKMKHIDYATVRVSVDSIKNIKLLEENNFYLVDSIITFELEDFISVQNNNVRDATIKDYKKLSKMVKDMYKGTRYNNDDFTSARANDIYSQWLKNSIEKTAADHVLVYDKNGLQGFVTIKNARKKIYNLALVGISKRTQGRGIGKKLVVAAINKCATLGATSLRVDTQINNIIAIRTYISCGFQPSDAFFTFAWRKNNN